MISLKIGSSERRNKEITERWISQQLRKRRKANQPICVQLKINAGDVNLFLASGACAGRGGGGGGRRKPKNKELRIIELWKERGLNGTEINPGMLISFFQQLESVLGRLARV